MREQRHYGHDQLSRGTQPVEDRAFRRGESFVALLTEKPLLFARMDPDIPLASLASGGTRSIGTEYCCGVHDCPPGGAGEHARKSMSGPPFALQLSTTTVYCRATHSMGFQLISGILPYKSSISFFKFKI